MAVPIWAELVCRECSRTTSGEFFYSYAPRQKMVNQAKEIGWQFKHDDCFCSNCCLKIHEEIHAPT